MANSQLHNDPERLRKFAIQLNQFATTADERLADIRSHIGHLGQSWRDQEFERFVQQFASTQNRLKGFIEETKRITPTLEADASKLEDYLRFRMD